MNECDALVLANIFSVSRQSIVCVCVFCISFLFIALDSDGFKCASDGYDINCRVK